LQNRLILDNDKLYQLLIIYPEEYKNSPRVNRFFDSFKLSGEGDMQSSITNSKKELILRALSDDDSLRMLLANRALRDYEFTEEDTSLIIPYLAKSYGNEEDSYRGTLISLHNAIGQFATTAQLNSIKLRIPEFADNRPLQNALAAQLFQFPEAKAHDTFIEILLAQPDSVPFSRQLYQYFYHFSYSGGVWPLAKKYQYADQIVGILDRPDYWQPVATLFFSMQDSALLNIEDYPSLVSKIEEQASTLIDSLAAREKKEYYGYYEEQTIVSFLGKLPSSPQRIEMIKVFAEAKDINLKRMALLALAKQNQKVSKKAWKFFEDRPEQKWLIHQSMQEADLLASFPFKKLSEQELAKGNAMYQAYLEDDYFPDASEFVSSHIISHEDQDLRFYIFKLGWQEEGEAIEYYYLSISGGFALDSQYPTIVKDASQILYDADLEILDEEVARLIEDTKKLLLESE